MSSVGPIHTRLKASWLPYTTFIYRDRTRYIGVLKPLNISAGRADFAPLPVGMCLVGLGGSVPARRQEMGILATTQTLNKSALKALQARVSPR